MHSEWKKTENKNLCTHTTRYERHPERVKLHSSLRLNRRHVSVFVLTCFSFEYISLFTWSLDSHVFMICLFKHSHSNTYIYSLTKCKCFQTQRTPNEFHNHFCLYKICSAHIFTRDFDCDYKWNLRERKNNYESWQTQVTNAYKLRALLKMRQRVGFSKCELKNSFSWPVFALKRIHGNANYTFRARLN